MLSIMHREHGVGFSANLRHPPYIVHVQYTDLKDLLNRRQTVKTVHNMIKTSSKS
jgi:hypothetical protein